MTKISLLWLILIQVEVSVTLVGLLKRYNNNDNYICPANGANITFLRNKLPTECADSCDLLENCYGFNYFPQTEDVAGCELIQSLCFRASLEWYRNAQYYMKRSEMIHTSLCIPSRQKSQFHSELMDAMLKNYTFNHGYCDGFDLSWGQNITDLYGCALRCWASPECNSFQFKSSCQPKGDGCNLLHNISTRILQSFVKDKSNGFVINQTGSAILRQKGFLYIETRGRPNDSYALISDNITIAILKVVNTAKTKANPNLRNVVNISDTHIIKPGCKNYSLVNIRNSKFMELSICRYHDAKLVQKITFANNLTNPREYVKGKEGELECRALGFPLPLITWKFRKCVDEDPICDLDWNLYTCDMSICSRPNSNYTEIDGSFLVESQLKFLAKETGTFQCCTYNKQSDIECNEQAIIVTDIDIVPPFKITHYPATIALDFTLDLTCKAQSYDYDNMTWDWQTQGTTKWLTVATLLPNREIYKHFNHTSETKFEAVERVDYDTSTIGLGLTMEKLQPSQRGTFRCGVFDKIHNKTIYQTIDVTPSKPISDFVIAVSVLGPLLVILVILVIVLKYREAQRTVQLQQLYTELRRSAKDNVSIDSNMPINQQVDNLPFISALEVPMENLQLGDTLGQGEFGTVLQANLRKRQVGVTETVVVAVKRPRDRRNPEHYKSLISELKLMSHIGRHINIVCLLGTITKKIPEGELYLLLEWCEMGSLKEFLVKMSNKFEPDPQDAESVPIVRKPSHVGQQQSDIIYFKRNLTKITTSDLMGFAHEVASGMTYLSAKHLIHRDLAARNVLLTTDLVAKISDFGLAKEFYTYQLTKKSALPIKWLSIEAWAKGNFSSKSDVWAFGILCWEIFTLGDIPYAEVPIDQLLASLKNGYRLKKPVAATDGLYDLMSKCWLTEATERPTFPQLKVQLSELFKSWNRGQYEEMLSRLDYCEAQMQKELLAIRQRKKSTLSLEPFSMAPKVKELGRKFPFFRFCNKGNEEELIDV